MCLTDAPYYGVDGQSYLLDVHADTGYATQLATWQGSPVPLDVVAVLDPSQGVLYAVLADEAADAEYIIGWNASSGELLSQVSVPATSDILNAVWEPRSARVLGTLDDRKLQRRDFSALDLSRGTSKVISEALNNFTTVYSIVSAAPELGAVFMSAYKGKGVNLVGVSAGRGAIVYDKPEGSLCTSLVYLP